MQMHKGHRPNAQVNKYQIHNCQMHECQRRCQMHKYQMPKSMPNAQMANAQMPKSMPSAQMANAHMPKAIPSAQRPNTKCPSQCQMPKNTQMPTANRQIAKCQSIRLLRGTILKESVTSQLLISLPLTCYRYHKSKLGFTMSVLECQGHCQINPIPT